MNILIHTHTHTDPWRGINPDCSLVQISRTHTYACTHTIGKLTHRTQWHLSCAPQPDVAEDESVCDACVCVCVQSGSSQVCGHSVQVSQQREMGFSATGCLSARRRNRDRRSAVTGERETDSQKESLNTGTLQKKRAPTVGTYHKALSPLCMRRMMGKGFVAPYGWTGDAQHW